MFNARTTADMESEGRMQKFTKRKMKTSAPMQAKKKLKLRDILRKKGRQGTPGDARKYYA